MGRLWLGANKQVESLLSWLETTPGTRRKALKTHSGHWLLWVRCKMAPEHTDTLFSLDR